MSFFTVSSFYPHGNKSIIRHEFLYFPSPPFVYLSIFFNVEPQGLDYGSFVACFEITKYNTSGFVLFQHYFGSLGSFCCFVNFSVSFFSFCGECRWCSDRDSIDL